MSDLRVLVVDDDFRVARLHAAYVGAADGFEVVGTAHTLADALELDATRAPDLVLLDEYLPDGSGSEAVRRFRAAVVMVSAAEDPEVVRRAIEAGALNYVLKPFPPPVLLDRLEAFRRFRRSLPAGGEIDQTGVDRALQSLRVADSPVARSPKGRSPVTSEAVVEALRRAREPMTAVQVAEATGVSRATAQRYLADLARDGRVRLSLRYGTTGRPEHCFDWLGPR